jgi:hypothetical protein
MANQSKLKAWVRYDGTNTVVTAGPIFRASKPKVGNWRQINADLCCNPVVNTTTTTTTSSSSTTSTTSSTTTQASIDVLFSGVSCGGGTGMTIQFTTGVDLCDAPLAISGDFSFAPDGIPFYIIYNGISKAFIKTSPTTAEGLGGAPNECVACG